MVPNLSRAWRNTSAARNLLAGKTLRPLLICLQAPQEKPEHMILEAELQRVDPTTAVFHLTGRMTLGMRLREVESKITEVIEGGVEKLILDLSSIEFLDSAGLGVLMILYGNMKVRGGQLRLVAPGSKVLEILKITHTDSILPIDSNLDAALAA
jgi:anti-sigma B factor antagonist